jgi:hypothetical protein
MNIEEDESTGLPVVPEGYLWRVRMGALHINKLDLRKKTWYGSRKVDSRVLWYYDDYRNVLDPRDEIWQRAVSIMKEFVDPWTEFYGDYPPKTLNGGAE